MYCRLIWPGHSNGGRGGRHRGNQYMRARLIYDFRNIYLPMMGVVLVYTNIQLVICNGRGKH
ncbi:hypothetical protein Micbo1qcDRAFT_161487 [Microdochium bolleyi]|uniref:Uncharacterized protein n=1 Tax=Microdochium bolleyi TaxID=196109 RepID=A0A136J8K5_9PEZI|nr:hypothetical protein Micbo1qcDRAFT_161487 [Microdochium bolleyi]